MLTYVIEGCDGAGKETVTKLLMKKIPERYNELTNSNCTIYNCSFPDYEIESGKAIKEYLAKEERYTDFLNLYAAALLFAKNRKEHFEQYPIGDASYCLFDRYMESNLLYQTVGLSDDDTVKLHDALNKLEFGVFNNPKPRQVFFLEVPLDTLLLRVESRKELKSGVEKDYNESRNMMIKVYENSQRIRKLFPQEFISINTVENGRIKNPNEIANDILAKLILL